MKKISLRVSEKATVRIRTENLLIKSQPLYHLSYDSLSIEREPRKTARCIILGVPVEMTRNREQACPGYAPSLCPTKEQALTAI